MVRNGRGDKMGSYLQKKVVIVYIGGEGIRPNPQNQCHCPSCSGGGWSRFPDPYEPGLARAGYAPSIRGMILRKLGVAGREGQ
jgi:hypothetical protein